MPDIPQPLLQQLCDLLVRLRDESANFSHERDNIQSWYNRGYAQGMLVALAELLGDERPCGLAPDADDLLGEHRVMAWGKAYRHGESVGYRETYEITGNT